MKAILQQYLFNFSNLKKSEKYKKFMRELQIKIQPLMGRWIRFTPREKQLVFAVILAGGIFILLSIVSSVMDITDKVNRNYTLMQDYKLSSTILNQEYKELSLTTANTFSTVSLARIQDDVSQALEVKTPDVSIQDTTLTIKADNVLFNSVVLFLEQLRKSYGIFPNKLTMTQSRSGYITFKATFLVSQ